MFTIGKAIVIDGKREKMRSKDSIESFLTQIKNLHNVKDSIIHKTIVIVYIFIGSCFDYLHKIMYGDLYKNILIKQFVKLNCNAI